MSEGIAAAIVSYVSTMLLTFMLCAAKARELKNSRWAKQRAKWARAALWSPLWPLLGIYVASLWVHELLSDLVDWSRQ